MLFKLTKWGIGNTGTLYVLAMLPVLMLAQSAVSPNANVHVVTIVMASAESAATAAVSD